MGKNGKSVKKEKPSKPAVKKSAGKKGKSGKFGFFKIVETLIIFAAALVIFYLYNTDKTNKFWPEETQKKSLKKERVPQNKEKDWKKFTTPEKYKIDKRFYAFKGGEIYFDEDIESALVSVIDEASSSVKAVSYTFGNGPLADALERAHKRGVSVELVCGKMNNNQNPPYKFVLFEPRNAIMHEKFIIADSGKKVVITSSNLTDNNQKNNAVVFYNVPKLLSILSKEFDYLKNREYGKECTDGCNFEYGRVFFSPGRVCSNVKKEILSAKNHINMAMYTFTLGTPMVTGLTKVVNNGIRLDALVDDWNMNGDDETNLKAQKFFSSLGADIDFDNMETVSAKKLMLHHKFSVIDGKKLVFGSMNWTKSGCYKNRELTVITLDSELAAAFENYYESLNKLLD